MMCHNTKFENKMFDGLEDIIWTKIKVWPFATTLTPNVVIKCFSQDTLASDDVSSDQVWLPRNQHFRWYSRKSPILIIWALAVTLNLKMATTTKMSAWLWLIMQHHHTRFVTKCSVRQKILFGQTFTDISTLCCDLDLENSNSIFPQDTPAYDAVLSNQVW